MCESAEDKDTEDEFRYEDLLVETPTGGTAYKSIDIDLTGGKRSVWELLRLR